MVRCGSRYSGNSSGNAGAIIIAASDAPDSVKSGADVVVDGVADQVQIQEILDLYPASANDNGAGIVLSQGTFSFSAAVILPNHFSIRGGGVYVTKIQMASGSEDDMFRYENAEHAIEYAAIRDMLCIGQTGDTVGSCINNVTQLQNLHIDNVFISAFAEDGIRTRDTWGWNISNSTIQSCGDRGISVLHTTNYTITGDAITGGGFAVNDIVTQAITGATGVVREAASLSATTLKIYQLTGAFSTGAGKDIDNGTATMADPTAITFSDNPAPKIIGSKIISNVGEQIYFGPGTTQGVISACETSATTGKFAILLDGSVGNQIENCRFNGMTSGMLGYIGLDEADTDTGTTKNAYSNLIMGNNAVCNINSIPAFHIVDFASASNVIKSNNFILSSGYLINPVKSSGAISRSAIYDNVYGQSAAAAFSDYAKLTYEEIEFDANQNASFPWPGVVYANSNFTITRNIGLPAATIGKDITFVVTHASAGYQVNPKPAETLNLEVGGAQQIAEKWSTNATQGSMIRYKCFLTGVWECVEVVGTWTVEA